MAISNALQQAVIERAQRRCEYCQAQKRIILYVEIDHIIPQSKGGKDGLNNLCLTCRVCNGHKASAQEAVDPLTRMLAPLFNPRTEKWIDHFQWLEDGAIVAGLTPTGRATIECLHLNDPDTVATRREWMVAGWHPPKD